MRISNNSPQSNNGDYARTIICPNCSQRNSPDDILCKKCKKVLPNTVVEVKSKTLRVEPKQKTSRTQASRTQEVKAEPGKPRSKSYKNSAIAILSLAAGLGALLFGGTIYYRNQATTAQQSVVKDASEVKTKTVVAAYNLEQYVGDQYLQVRQMAASPFLSDRQIWSAWSSDRKQEYFQNNFVANANGVDSYVTIDTATGETVLSGGMEMDASGDRYSDYYRQVVRSEQPVVVPRQKLPQTGMSYMYIAAPSFDKQKKLLFVTIARIKFDEIQAEIAASFDNLNSIVDEPQTSDFFLIDDIGRIIAAENPELLERHINKLYPTIESLREQGITSVEMAQGTNDSNYILAYTPVVEKRGLPELNWSLISATQMLPE